MTKLIKSIVMLTSLVLIGGLATIPFFTSASKEDRVMGKIGTIPPIDASKPVKTETATFALC